MISRRALMVGAVSVASVIGTRQAKADNACAPHPKYGQACRAQVNFQAFSARHDPQYQSQWCWAACISNVFKYYGHPVAQQRIVSEVYGGPVNMPAMAGIIIAQQLNRAWRDDNGRQFTSILLAAYDLDARHFNLSDQHMVQMLAANNPLVIGAGSHAMVLTAVDYAPTMDGPTLLAGGVFDPWPGRGPRPLAPPEFVAMHRGGALRFLASAQIT